MKIGSIAAGLPALTGVLSLMSLCSLTVLADDAHTHLAAAQSEERTTDQKGRGSELLQIVRDATRRFKDVQAAEAEGYGLLFGCVSGESEGAMGLHYVNMPLVLDGEIDPERPEIILYEPVGNGQVRLTGADYLVFADAWDKKHSSAPELMGQKFQQFEAPNRFGLPRFYTLHVWAWKDSPTGTFVNWNSRISCDAFNGPTQ